KGLASVGRLPASNRLDLIIGLPLRNRETLTNFLDQLYDPASTNFHRYLTPEQFAERFGPTEQDYQAVIAFARSAGFKVAATHPNRTLLNVNASVGEVEKAFRVKMRVYQHPSEPRTFYAPDVEPSLEWPVAVLHISGLHNFQLPHPCLAQEPFDFSPVPND